MVVHFFGFIVVVNLLLEPLLGLKHLPGRNYIIIDRYKIKGISRFERLNCMFCGWANGLSMLMHARLEQLGSFDQEVPAWKKLIIALVLALIMPILIITQTMMFQFVYNILISRPLGMKRMSRREAYREISDIGFASQLGFMAGTLVKYQKSCDLRLENALEQIESSWCPLKHLDQREEVVYSRHHKNFFDPDQIEEMKKVLQSEGTVSDVKPYW